MTSSTREPAPATSCTGPEVSLGRISYLNVLPIYYPLENGIIPNDFKFVSGPPARLNELMAQGELDLSSASSIEYGRHFEDYLLLPNLAIGSQGPVQSVLLLSRLPLQDLKDRAVLISSQTHTSAALLRLILAKDNIQAPTTPGDIYTALKSSSPPAAFLAIGDEALRLRNLEAYPYQLDLGQAWLEWTGLPFIFGVWVVSRKALDHKRQALVKARHKLLASKQWGRQRIDFFCDLISRQGILNHQKLKSYFQGLVYEFGSRQRQGLTVFYQALVQAGHLSRMPRLDFFD